MGVFDRQRIDVYSMGVQFKPGTKQPVSAGTLPIAVNVPCTITGTQTENLKLFILRKHYLRIPDGLHRGYKVVLVGNDNNTPKPLEYQVVREPVWAGGSNHHVEVDLNEWK